MNKLLLSILSASLLSLNIYGEDSPLQVSSHHPHNIYFGPEIFLFDLNTQFKDVQIDSLKLFGGLRLRYEYLKPSAFYAGVDIFSALSGGGLDARPEGYSFQKNNSLTGFSNLELRLGYTVALNRGVISPFVGLGAYYTGNFGRKFHFSETLVYYAAGMRSLFDFNSVFSMGTNFKVFYADDADQKFKYRSNGVIKHTAHPNMWGGEIGLPLVWHVGSAKRWEVQLEPYFLKLDFTDIQNIYGTRLLFGYKI